MNSYSPRLTISFKACSQCGNECEDFDKYYNDSKNCLQRQKERKKEVVLK